LFPKIQVIFISILIGAAQEVFMMSKLVNNWYFTSPGAISRYLVTVIRGWGYPVTWNRSEDSESLYLKVSLGTLEVPRTLHIRISNHTIPPETLRVVFDADVYCSYEREGATNYIKLIAALAEETGKPPPPILARIRAGTQPYKKYRIEMQHRKKRANDRRHGFSSGERLYV
jgi:hypothetical protein